VSFDVSADAYLRFMGRYSEPLAVQFADLAGVGRGQRVLDVGCGPGALTAELVRRTGADAVSAVEPSASFAAAVRERLPGVDVLRSAAEQLPFPDDAFDAALAQLVVHFMTDPVRDLGGGPVPGPGPRPGPAVPGAGHRPVTGRRGRLRRRFAAAHAMAGGGHHGAFGTKQDSQRAAGRSVECGRGAVALLDRG
jgi:SAM-dependent methyltransferase